MLISNLVKVCGIVIIFLGLISLEFDIFVMSIYLGGSLFISNKLINRMGETK